MKYIVDYTYWSPGGNKVCTTQTFDCPREPSITELTRIFTNWGQRVERIHSVERVSLEEEAE
jgi:hypothetical protein